LTIPNCSPLKYMELFPIAITEQRLLLMWRDGVVNIIETLG